MTDFLRFLSLLRRAHANEDLRARGRKNNKKSFSLFLSFLPPEPGDPRHGERPAT